MRTGKIHWARDRRIRRAAFLVVLLASGLVIRCNAARQDVYPSVDGVYYLEQTRDMVAHHRVPYGSFPPGWPALVAVPMLFLDATDADMLFRAAQGANIASTLVLAVLTSILIRRNSGEAWALFGLVVMLFLPQAIIAAKGDLSEPSYGVAVLSAFLLFNRHRTWSGILLGYAYLIRPEALGILVAVAAVETWRSRRIPLGLVAGGLAFVIPYALFLRYTGGEWTISGKTGFLVRAWQDNVGASYARLVGANLVTLLRSLLSSVGAVIVVVAAVGAWRNPRHAFLAMIGVLPLPLFSFAMAGRFWLPYVPFVLLAAVLGMRSIAHKFTGRARTMAVWALVIAAGGGAALASRDDAHWVRYNPNAYEGLREAGLWLKGRVAADTRIAAYKPSVSFLAGCEFVKYPEGADLDALLDDLEARGVEYLIVNAHVARAFVPALRPLLSRDAGSAIKRRVEPVHVAAPGHNDQFTVVFRLLPGR